MIVLSESTTNNTSNYPPSSISTLANTKQLLWSKLFVFFGHWACHCVSNSAHPWVTSVCNSDNDSYRDHIVLKDLAKEKQKAQAITNSKYKDVWFSAVTHYWNIITHDSVGELYGLGHHDYTKADRHISRVYFQILSKDILNTNYYHYPSTCKYVEGN